MNHTGKISASCWADETPVVPGEPGDAAAGQARENPVQPAWRRFDPVWYGASYPQARAEAQRGGEAAVERFYHEQGCALGHSPNMFFDERWYLSAYPDVAAHVAAGGAASGFAHYCLDGCRSHSPHWLFSEAHYLAANPDVTPELLDRLGLANGYDHYLTAGDAALRSGHSFFEPRLYEQNAQEGEAARARDGGPFERFLADGARAGSTARLSWYFDPRWYLQTYPEVQAEIDRGLWACALHHFLANAAPGRYAALEWFSEAFYGARYPDVATDGGFRNSYEHFIRFGAAELRQPHPQVDLLAHVRSLRVQAELERGDHPDAFAHWVAGRAAGAGTLAEPQAKELFRRMAEALLPAFAREPLDFTPHAPPAVSVIMVLHDQFALTMTALASLRACFGGDIELILADSGSRDETRRIGRYVRGARVVRFEDNVGFVASCNAVLAHASAAAVLYMNNDVTLGPRAVGRALERLASDASIGAVGPKFVRTDGSLQEAGCIIWRDGSTSGYLRDADPSCPEANFVREVDFCSAAFLLVRAEPLRRLGGFDPGFQPAYYEETDLCVRLRKAGLRVVYDPSVMVQHVEYGSAGAGGPLRPARMIARNREVFVARHRDWLRHQYPSGARNAPFARQPRPGPGRILLIEDQVPRRALGSGYVRSNDIVHAMTALGHQVGIYPLHPVPLSPPDALRDFPDTAEVLHDRGLDELAGFIEARRGYYDVVWIGRTHNLARLLSALGEATAFLPERGVVLDTEAVAAPRAAGRARLLGEPAEELDALLRRELACAYFCQHIVAVSERDAALIRQAGHGNVSVLGHVREPVPTPAGWAGRAGLLFLGALHEVGSPNYDSLAWFVGEVLPLLHDRLAPDVRFTVAGHVERRVDLSALRGHPRVELLGPVDDLAELYNRHRVFVAPTRFAGGIPFKLHEAASFGLPAVASALLCRQVGWADGVEILSGGDNDPVHFANRVVELYETPALWAALRGNALRRIEAEHCPADYRERLGAILAAVSAGTGEAGARAG